LLARVTYVAAALAALVALSGCESMNLFGEPGFTLAGSYAGTVSDSDWGKISGLVGEAR